MLRKTNLLITLAMALFLTACAGTGKGKDGGAIGGTDTGADSGANSGLNSGDFDPNNAWGTGYTQAQLEALGITKNPLEYDTVFFEYDSSQITERSQRRAVSVQNLMASIGAGSNSIAPVTYGEERPVQLGQTPEAWSSNRRVQILK